MADTVDDGELKCYVAILTYFMISIAMHGLCE